MITAELVDLEIARACPRQPQAAERPVAIRVGISACLMGKSVRFDGSHKRDRFLTEALGEHVDWVPVCPEVGAGLGVPRPTLRLIGDPRAPRLVTSAGGPNQARGSRGDQTRAVAAYTHQALDRLAALDLCGFVLKSGSPTCGMERVRVYDHDGVPHKTGVGLFARALMERFPLLPVEEEGRLRDAGLREAFLDAVFAHARWRCFLQAPFHVDGLIDFHRCNKCLLRVHSPRHAALLGQLVAAAGSRDTDAGDIRGRYGTLFMQAMKVRPTPRKHVDMLRRIAGHLRPYLSPGGRVFLHETIDDYAAGLTARSVPLALLRHHAQEHRVTYLGEQSYLAPYPKQLGRA